MAQQDRERGERIAELRKAAGYTSADKLAHALDVNYRSVQNWEAGKGISEDNVKDLGELLGVTREFILYGPAETPDIMGALNGDTGQLDRIEKKLDALLDEVAAMRIAAASSEETRSRPRAGQSKKKSSSRRAA